MRIKHSKEDKVLSILTNEQQGLEAIAQKTGLSLPKTVGALLILELRHKARQHPGHTYTKSCPSTPSVLK